MNVTIISDASLDPLAKIGSYAFWAVSKRGKHAGSGIFKGELASSTHAEMMAIVNGLHMAIALQIAQAEDKILIQSDCASAIQLLERAKVKQRDEHIIRRFRQLRDENRLTIELRWVKGHAKQDDARYRAQKSADQRSRKLMRQARKSVVQQPEKP